MDPTTNSKLKTCVLYGASPVFVSWKYNYNILLQHKTTKNLLFWHFETVVPFILRTFELQLGHNEIAKTEMVQLFFAGDTA